MPAKIDELQLQIEADASGAIKQLGNLSSALKQVADRADGLKSAASGLNDFSNAVDKMAGANVTKSVHRLQKLASIDYSNLRTGAQSVNLLANSLSQLGNVNIDTKGVNKFASSIKDMQTVASSGGKSPIDRAYTTSMYTAGDAIKTVTGHALQLGSKGASALANFASRMGMIPKLSGGIDRTALSFGNLLRTITPFIGLRGIFGWAQDAVKTGSSIVEVENVIDTSFGNMKKGYEDISGYIYKWAQTTIDGFGVSELAAKQYAGRLMSMFNSSGFDATEGMRDSAAKMSTELIERAGDIASFYDITVDEAMTKIQSGLAGVTRPLRSLGINMTVANMQAYALSQGITTSWQSMDQATQMALRYNYILEASKYAQSDFQKTSQTFANQIRLLSLNFQVLSSTIGQGLISAIAPVISWLNLLIKRLIQAANAFRTFMFSLFGKAIGAAKGVSNDLADYLGDANDSVQDLGGGAGNAADGLGSAGKAAKDLKKQLTVLPFDELNQLAKDTEAASSGSGGGGAGGGGAGGGSLGDIGSLLDMSEMDLSGSPVIDAVNKWAEKMRKAFIQGDWTKLGHTIAEGINSGFQKIYEVLDWKKVGPKVYGFIQPFQATINSMMNKIDWHLIGKTFARGLNDITNTFRMFINGFNWRLYGQKFATGMNGFLEEWDAETFGRAIADKFRAAWNWFGGWVETFNFSLLGQKLKKAIVGAFDEMNWNDMGKSLGKLLTGIGTTLRNMFEDGEVKGEISSAVTEFINGFFEGFNGEEFAKGFSAFADTIINGIADGIFNADKGPIKEDIEGLLKNLPWGSIATVVGAVAGGKLAAGIFGSVFKKAAEKKISEIVVGNAVGSTVTGAATGGATNAVTTAVAGAGSGAAGAGAGALGVTSITASSIAIAGSAIIGGFALSAILGKLMGVKELKKDNETEFNGFKQTGTPAMPTQAELAKEIRGSSAPTTKATVVTTTMKGVVDSSFKTVLIAKNKLLADPIVTKTMDATETSKYKKGRTGYVSWTSEDIKKSVNAVFSNGYKPTKLEYDKFKSNTATKTADARQTNKYTSDKKSWDAWRSATIQKLQTGKLDKTYTDTLSRWNNDWGKTSVTKNTYGKKQDSYNSTLDHFNSKWGKTSATKNTYGTQKDSYKNLHKSFYNWKDDSVKMTVNGSGTKSYWDVSNNYNDLPEKKYSTFVLDVQTNVKRVFASWSNGAGDSTIAKILTENNAKGGLFTRPAAYQVFGEAGTEAAIPLERQSTLRRIGSAIADAGGVSNNEDIANAIAARILPAMASMMASVGERPVNVNATLYTENNEVLARAVNQGNRNLDKRYNPVSQFAFS